MPDCFKILFPSYGHTWDRDNCKIDRHTCCNIMTFTRYKAPLHQPSQLMLQIQMCKYPSSSLLDFCITMHDTSILIHGQVEPIPSWKASGGDFLKNGLTMTTFAAAYMAQWQKHFHVFGRSHHKTCTNPQHAWMNLTRHEELHGITIEIESRNEDVRVGSFEFVGKCSQLKT